MSASKKTILTRAAIFLGGCGAGLGVAAKAGGIVGLTLAVVCAKCAWIAFGVGAETLRDRWRKNPSPEAQR